MDDLVEVLEIMSNDFPGSGKLMTEVTMDITFEYMACLLQLQSFTEMLKRQADISLILLKLSANHGESTRDIYPSQEAMSVQHVSDR
jgi:hypothetical protein